MLGLARLSCLGLRLDVAMAAAVATACTATIEEAPGRIDETTQTGGPDGSTDETVAIGPAQHSLFVAAGFQGRRLASCDGGRTWVGDVSDRSPEEYRCDAVPEGDPSCDHQGNVAMGIAFGQDSFAADMGHGFEPPSVRRTRDGASWENFAVEGHFAGIAFREERWFLNSRDVQLWDPATGMPSGEPMDTGLAVHNPRKLVALDLDDGRHIVQVGSSETGDVTISPPGGLSWFAPPEPANPKGGNAWLCLSGGNVVGHNNHILMMGRGERAPEYGDNDGILCISHDRGQTWSQVVLPEYGYGLVSTGEVFWYWANVDNVTRRYESVDGDAWTYEEVSSAPPMNLVARGGGTYVSIGGQYEDQTAAYSVDGRNWITVDGFPQGHRITKIAYGTLSSAAVCAQTP